MSQEKVDRYKTEKANRKVILKREKRNKIVFRISGTIVCLAIVGWIGYSVYGNITKGSATDQTEINLDAAQNYLSGLQPEDTSDSAE